MQTTIVNLTINNPSLSALASRTYKPGYTPVPNTALPRVIQEQLKAMFRVLTGTELPAESSTLLIKASQGTFERLYTPTIFKRVDPTPEQTQLYIKWGDIEVDLQCGTKAGVTPKSGANDNLTALFAEVDQGRGLDKVVQFEYVDDVSDQVIIFYVPVRLEDNDKETGPQISQLNILAKRNIKDLCALINEAPKGTGGLGGDVVSLKDLEVGAYSVTGFRTVNTKYGTKYILRIAAQVLLGREVEFECWGDKNLNAVLGSDPQPTITAEKPAQLTVISKTELLDGKCRVQASLIVSDYAAVEGGLSLNFD